VSADGLREQFVLEARDLLVELEAALLELETAPEDADSVSRAFRAMHTLKGSGSMAGLDDLAAFTHELESAFDRVRNGQLRITPELITVALRSADHLGREVEGLDTDETLRAREIALLDQLAAVLATQDGATTPAEAPGRPASEPPVEAEPEVQTFRLRWRPDGQLHPLGLDPVALLDEVTFLGESRTEAAWSLPPRVADLDPTCLGVEWTVEVSTPNGRDALADIFIFVPDEAAPTIEEVGAPSPMDSAVEGLALVAAPSDSPAPAVSPGTPSEAAAAVRTADSAKQKTVASVRVPAPKLDRLFDLVGELVIAQARLNQLAGESTNDMLVGLSEELAHLTNDLRDSAMEIRMLPVGSTFGRFRRLVRDLAQQLGKDVELVTSGDDVELDKNVIDRLNDPLIHLIRNGIDHGIESREQRIAAGKPARGRVSLRAEHVSGNVVIEIADDGKGLDLDHIYAKAVDRGLIPEGARPSDRELREIIFAAGLSTADSVTDVSGRGVGMDVVRSAISDLRGRIEVDSTPGKGSCFRVTLPLTLAIIEGLLLELDESKYVVPLAIVEECLEIRSDRDRTSADRGIIDVRGELVPYLRLRSWFGADSPRPDVEQVVVVNLRDERFGFVVDQVIGQHQTVVKGLGRMFGDIRELSGATILGDGTVALILDVNLLVEHLRTLTECDGREAPASEPVVATV
jgi:two-component system chemotaxis sensor kinase CheA